MEAVLSVRGLSKAFGGLRAVDDVSFEIGVAALAVPVFDSRGNVARSLGVIAPRDRLLLEQRDELLQDMRDTAATLGHALTS